MGRLESIQILRGVAATLVAGFHLYAVAQGRGYEGLFTAFKHGEAGVDLFFVISGFVILYSVEKRKNMSVGEFSASRFWRIFPPYWAILTLYVLMKLALGVVTGNPEMPSGLLVSYALLPYPDHIIVIAWTLSVELIFYILFALSYFSMGKRGLFSALVMWVIASQVFKHMDSSSEYLLLPLHSAVMEFLFGALIGHLYLAGKTPFQRPALLLGITLLILYMSDLLDPNLSREFLPGIPAALIVYGVLSWKVRVPAAILLLGEASYILYLLHLLIYSTLGVLVRQATGFDVYTTTVSMALMLVIAVVTSCLLSRYLEQPYQRWYKQRFLRKPMPGRTAQ